jgi:hypothetical protein
MFHPSTERLIEYWSQRKAGGRIPARSGINPGDFSDLVPQAFILGREGMGAYPFRLAGGFLTELHQRDLRGDNMLDLWSPASRAELRQSLEATRAAGEPLVIVADIHATGVATVGMEVAFLPLTTAGGEVNRFLGLYQPIAMVQRLQGQPANELSIRRPGSLELTRPALRLVAVEGRRLG